jgi:radical SAM protein with 4Fe4S-binding SPASM domain
MARTGSKADALAIPLNAHLDLTWRCNAGCGHCYLDHGVGGDMTTAEIRDMLGQLAAAGTLFLTISGGEIMLRKDIFEIVACARSLMFDVRLKTNGILIGEAEAERFAALGVREVDISIYSGQPEVHDGVTRVPGSLERSLDALRRLKRHGVRAEMRGVIMRGRENDYHGVQALAAELGIRARFDATITPRMDGGLEPVASFQVSHETLKGVFRDPALVADVGEFCAPPAAPDDDALNGYPCSAGHSGCYISPQGDVTPCVQFPLVCGNLRRNSFAEIWRNSSEFARVREIRNRDVAVCSSCSNFSSCTRCPGLACQEGDMAGPSSLDCEKAYARTGVPPPLAATTSGHAALRRQASRGSWLVPLAPQPPPQVEPYRDAAAD